MKDGSYDLLRGCFATLDKEQQDATRALINFSLSSLKGLFNSGISSFTTSCPLQGIGCVRFEEIEMLFKINEYINL